MAGWQNLGVRNALLYALDQCRAILGPAVMDLRPSSIHVITRTWSGGVRGGSAAVDVVLPLPNYTKLRHVSTREVTESGGLFEMGDIICGPITPQYTAPDGTIGGFTEIQIAPAEVSPGVPTGTEIIYRLAQQSGATGVNGDYECVQFRRDKTLRFELVLRRRIDTP
jgi:hypothetical protein